MYRTLLLIVLSAMSVLLSASAEAAYPALSLHAGTSAYTPASRLRVWVDSNRESKIEDAEAALRAGEFTPVERWPPTFGFADGVYWFALDLDNVDHPDGSWLYVIEYALLDHLDLRIDYADGRQVNYRSGDREPYAARSVDHRHFNFELELARGQSARTLLRVQTESSVQVPIAIYSDHAFLETH